MPVDEQGMNVTVDSSSQEKPIVGLSPFMNCTILSISTLPLRCARRWLLWGGRWWLLRGARSRMPQLLPRFSEASHSTQKKGQTSKRCGTEHIRDLILVLSFVYLGWHPCSMVFLCTFWLQCCLLPLYFLQKIVSTLTCSTHRNSLQFLWSPLEFLGYNTCFCEGVGRR